MANDTGGVWRTVGGRRIFIKTGQSLSSAMKESGKFKKASDVKREEFQKKNAEIKELNATEREKALEELKEYSSMDYESAKENNAPTDEIMNRTRQLKEEYEKGKNDTETLKKIADSNEDISGRKDLDDIEKDYIKNRREEISRNQRIKEFTDNANKTNEKTKAKALERENDNLAKAQKEYDENPSDFREIAKDYGLKGDDYKKYKEYAQSKTPEGIDKEAPHKNVFQRSDAEIDDALQNFNDYKKYEKFSGDEWNSASQRKRDQLAKDSIKKYLNDNHLTREEVRDLSDAMENENYNTEARWVEDVYDQMQKAQKSIPRNLRVGPGDLTDNDKDVLNAAYKEFSGTKTGSNDWIRNAFEQYKKDHPGSKLTLAAFKKTAKK